LLKTPRRFRGSPFFAFLRFFPRSLGLPDLFGGGLPVPVPLCRKQIFPCRSHPSVWFYSGFPFLCSFNSCTVFAPSPPPLVPGDWLSPVPPAFPHQSQVPPLGLFDPRLAGHPMDLVGFCAGLRNSLVFPLDMRVLGLADLSRWQRRAFVHVLFFCRFPQPGFPFDENSFTFFRKRRWSVQSP